MNYNVCMQELMNYVHFSREWVTLKTIKQNERI